jgi:hypothetical protein
MTSESDIFERRVWKCVDAALASLGFGVRDEILRYLRIAKQVDQRDVVRRPHVFVNALDQIFGEGAPLIISMIIGVMAIDFGFKVNPDGWAAAVGMAKASQV